MEVGQQETPHLSLAGPYKVVQRPDGIRLVRDYSFEGEFPDARKLVFANEGDAVAISQLLSIAFQEKGMNKGKSTIKVGNVLEFMVNGGLHGKCLIQRLEGSEKVGRLSKPTTKRGLIRVLRPYFGEKG